MHYNEWDETRVRSATSLWCLHWGLFSIARAKQKYMQLTVSIKSNHLLSLLKMTINKIVNLCVQRICQVSLSPAAQAQYINTLYGTNYGCAHVLEIRLNYIISVSSPRWTQSWTSDRQPQRPIVIRRQIVLTHCYQGKWFMSPSYTTGYRRPSENLLSVAPHFKTWCITHSRLAARQLKQASLFKSWNTIKAFLCFRLLGPTHISIDQTPPQQLPSLLQSSICHNGSAWK